MMTRLFSPQTIEGTEKGPLYLRLQEAIRTAITDQRLHPGDALPPEREIATAMGISRVTVRKAIQGLVESGILRQKQGSGTYVSQSANRVEQPLSRLTSFTEDMESRGLVPSVHWIERTIALPAPDEAIVLGLSTGERVARIYRLRLADNEPMAIERAVVPERFLGDPKSVQKSLYDVLNAGGFRPVRALQRLRAETLGPADAELLDLPPETAALHIERVSYLGDGRAVEFTRSIYRGDRYDFVAELYLAGDTS